MQLIKASHISKYYNGKCGGVRALKDISLDIGPGECIGIIGESGCGKSTLARVLSCIETPDEGQVMFEGRPVIGTDLKDFRRQVQMVFQSPIGSFSPRMKIGRFLMEPWLNYEKLPRRKAREMAKYGLERVGLDPSYYDKYPHELSGGELQRIAIARACALHPKLLICDEATSALDVSIQKAIMAFLKEHKEEENCSILFISHDLALAENFCDRIYVMYMGRIVEILPGNKLSHHARHPYSRALLASVFNVDEEKDAPIFVLEGEPDHTENNCGCAFAGRCNKAMPVCRQSEPVLTGMKAHHQVACHLYQSPSRV